MTERLVSKLHVALLSYDEREIRVRKNYLEEQNPAICCVCFHSGEEFLDAWAKSRYDVVILDIFIGEKNGMEIARIIRNDDKDVRIVFATASNEFAGESYEVNASYYLHKPYGEDQIKIMLERLKLDEVDKRRTAMLPDGTAIILRNIVYADFAAHCVNIHYTNSPDVKLRTAFRNVEATLCEYPGFFSPSKGIVINLNEVSAQKNDIFLMSDDTRIPISRRKAKEAVDIYTSYCFEKLRKGGEC